MHRLELYDVDEESFTMEILANDPDVMDDKKIISEMIESKESPRQSSLQCHNYKLPNETVGFGRGHCRNTDHNHVDQSLG